MTHTPERERLVLPVARIPQPDDVSCGPTCLALFDPARPWEAGLAASMVEALSVTGLVVRANEPWLGVDDGHTTALRVRFPAERYAGIELELGQGLEPAARRAVVAAWVGWFGHQAAA